MMIRFTDLIEIAARLASEDGENPEYDRALADLIGDAFGVEGQPFDERADDIAVMIDKRMREMGLRR